jgi:hypothetical protein
MTLVATLQEFKDWIKYGSGTTDDDELTLALTAASSWVEWRQSGPLSVTPFTERLHSSGEFLQPRKQPLVAVTSVTPQDGAALAASSYIVDTTNGFIQFRYGGWASGWYTVAYTAGLAVIPERVKLAGMETSRHLWLVRNGSAARGYPGDDLVQTPLGFAVPARAEELMAANPDGTPGGFA